MRSFTCHRNISSFSIPTVSLNREPEIWGMDIQQQDLLLMVGRSHAWVFHWWLSYKESACQEGDMGSIPGSGRLPWRRIWQPTPVSLPGKSHGPSSLAGYSPWGRKGVGYDLEIKQQQSYLRTNWYLYIEIHFGAFTCESYYKCYSFLNKKI